MLEKLGEVLRKATNKIANAVFLDKNLVDSIVRDLQRALIEADVNILLVKELSDKMKKAALSERIKEIDKKEHMIKLLHDELLNILGEHRELKLKEKQNRIMLLGLYGAGKTTTIAKLGNYYAKRGKKVVLAGLDVHRPAAKEQLKQLAEKNKLNYFIDEEEDAIKTWKKFEKIAKNYDVILIDTAGRHNLDKGLVEEIKALKKEIEPTETILVMPADIGQAAKEQALQFNKAVDISGVIITRMDSTAKGGGALTACAEIGKDATSQEGGTQKGGHFAELQKKAGVYFITTGEKINDIEIFNPESFLSRLLGMGDLQNLIEKIKSVTDEKKQKKIQEKLEEGKLSLEDVVEQVKSMNSLGGFSKIKSMIPGFANLEKFGKKNISADEALESQQSKIAKWEHIIKSMTHEEKENPEIFKDKKTGTSRINRIARGAGVNNSEIRSLLKQYDVLNDFIISGSSVDLEKGMSQKQMMKLAKKFMKGKKLKF
jgi:signal recognition particle subunit SRP54